MSKRPADALPSAPAERPFPGAPTSPLTMERDLFTFFLDRVETAVTHQSAPVTEPTVYYLSNLLAEQGRAEEDALPDTLVELRQLAANAPRAEAVTLWKRLGDRSLLLTGYFREYLARRRLSRDYVARMGSSAYTALEHMLGPSRGDEPEGFAAVFGELAERWHACVDVLAEVRDEACSRSDTDIVRLYEEWLTTGSPQVAERLRALGVVPVRMTGHS